MEKNIKVLIIPDVHGREFWREPVKDVLENTDAKIVFLGDYLDCYPYEFEYGIDYKEKSIANFNEIINLKKENKNRIILLLGNHDGSYRFDIEICDCRTDYKNYERISNIFNENKELFDIAYETYINDKHIIFSHAGISKQYAEYVFGEEVNENNVVDLFNNAYHTEDYDLIKTLGIYDRYRGSYGRRDFASLIWTDVRTWIDNEDKEYGYGYNVFGHTQLDKDCGGIIRDKFSDIDCQEVFYINENGELKEFFEKKEEKIDE